MYTFTREIRERLRPFLEEYIDFTVKAYMDDCLTVTAVKQGIKGLGNVFTAEELSKELIIECHVILPVCVINEILEGD